MYPTLVSTSTTPIADAQPAPLQRHSQATPAPAPQPPIPPDIRTTARDYVNPVDYQHAHPSMDRFAGFLALQYDANRTRHAYYRRIRLMQEHFTTDPATLCETQLRDYFLFLKLKKQWKPKSIRQALAAARMFFVQLLGHSDWTLFGQIRARDHDTLPAVLTRHQVSNLLGSIRLRRYRTPLMLNHFHVLVEVPKRPEVLPTAEEVIAKLKRMSGEHFVGMAEQQVA